jgi:type IX secretion system PorP/SprF family membrane protein
MNTFFTLFTFWLLFLPSMLLGQLLPNLAFYRQNWEQINPAAVNRWLFWDENDHQHHTFTVSGRNQWFGAALENTPKFLFASYEYSPEKDRNNRESRLKGGATLYYDRADAISTMSGSVTGSVSVDISAETKLSVGMGLRFHSYRVNTTNFRSNSSSPDPVILAWAAKERRPLMDVTSGLFLNKERYHYLGLSVPQFFSAAFRDTTHIKQKVAPHIYLTAGKYWYPTGTIEDGFFEFSTIARWVPRLTYAVGPIKKLSAELNARYWMRHEKFWIGGGYSTNRLMSAEAGYEFIHGTRNRNYNKSWRDRVGAVFTWPAGKLAAPFGYQFELSYSHAWY